MSVVEKPLFNADQSKKKIQITKSQAIQGESPLTLWQWKGL